MVETAESWREDAHPKGTAATAPDGFHVECGSSGVNSSSFSRETRHLVLMWNLPVLNVRNQFKNLLNTERAKQNSCELGVACRLSVCNLCSPETPPRHSMLPNICAFMALLFVLHVPLSGLPNSIFFIDPNPNSYLIFKMKLSLLCGMLDFSAAIKREQAGKPKSEMSLQVV